MASKHNEVHNDYKDTSESYKRGQTLLCTQSLNAFKQHTIAMYENTYLQTTFKASIQHIYNAQHANALKLTTTFD